MAWLHERRHWFIFCEEETTKEMVVDNVQKRWSGVSLQPEASSSRSMTSRSGAYSALDAPSVFLRFYSKRMSEGISKRSVLHTLERSILSLHFLCGFAAIALVKSNSNHALHAPTIEDAAIIWQTFSCFLPRTLFSTAVVWHVCYSWCNIEFQRCFCSLENSLSFRVLFTGFG